MIQGKKLTISYWEDSSRAERLLSMGLSTVCPTQQIPMQWWHRGPPKRVFPCLQYRLVAGTIPRPWHISQPRSWQVWLRNWFSPAEGGWCIMPVSAAVLRSRMSFSFLPFLTCSLDFGWGSQGLRGGWDSLSTHCHKHVLIRNTLDRLLWLRPRVTLIHNPKEDFSGLQKPYAPVVHSSPLVSPRE